MCNIVNDKINPHDHYVLVLMWHNYYDNLWYRSFWVFVELGIEVVTWSSNFECLIFTISKS
jgi:hypothetical protein